MNIHLNCKLSVCVAAALTLAVMSAALEAQASLKTWKAVEQWRVDGSHDGEPFGEVRDYVVTRDGALWILDFKYQVIRRFDAGGQSLPTVGRRGSGPGEFRNANGMAVGPDGSVWVNDPSNSRIAVFGVDGKFVHQIMSGTNGFSGRWIASSNKSAEQLNEEFFVGSGVNWKRYDINGKTLGTFPFTSCKDGKPGMKGFSATTPGKGSTFGAYPFTNGGGLAPDDAGNVWCAAASATRVALIRIGSKDSIVQTNIDIPAVRVSTEERNEAIAQTRKSLANYQTNDFDESNIPKLKSGIEALYVDDDGRLWVQHSPTYKSRSATFDVFDGKGIHQARITIPVSHRGYLPLRARGDLFWITVIDDDDVPSVVKYRIQK